MSPEGGRWSAAGLDLHVSAWNTASPHRPVLVLHGYLEQGFAWDRVARHLNRPVYAPDQRGFGRSDHVAASGFYHFWDYVADAQAIADRLGPSIDVVGHSMGGTVASLFAGARPEHVRRLVLIEGLGPPDFRSIALGRSRSFLNSWREPPSHPRMANLDEAVHRMRRRNANIDPEFARELAELSTQPTPDGGCIWTWDPKHRATSPNPFDADLFATWLRAITAPTLCIEGADSPFARHVDMEARRAALPASTRIVLPDSGHLAHHDQPELLAKEIERFLQEEP